MSMKMIGARMIADQLVEAGIGCIVRVHFTTPEATGNRFTIHVPGPLTHTQVKLCQMAAANLSAVVGLGDDGMLVIADAAP